MKRKKSFRHSSSARTQAALVRLRIALGPAGYGIYYMVLEHIYQTGRAIAPTDIDLLAYEFHCPEADLRSVLADFNLFSLTPEGYTVEQVSRPATPQSNKSDKSDNLTPSADIISQLDALCTGEYSILDSLYDDIYDQTHALDRIIDDIANAGQPFPSQDALLTHIRTKIQAYIAAHPEIVPEEEPS